MGIRIARNFFAFFILLLLQVFVVGKLNVTPLIQPNILLLFFLTLPINLKPVPTLLLGFTGGLLLDMFNNSAGFNSTALLLMCYARVYYIRNFAHYDVVESGVNPGLSTMGYRWFILFSVVMVSIYQIVYAFIESFGFRYIAENILSAVLSGAVSLCLILLFQLLFYRTKRNT